MKSPWRELPRIAHALASNLLAGMAPSLYVRLTRQTGRGAGEELPDDIAGYCMDSFLDYFDHLGVPRDGVEDWLHGKTALEYGPGDVPGVALLMLAHGAEKVWCVDRFPLVRLSDKNVDVLRQLLARLTPEQAARAEACFARPGDPASGLRADKLEYLVRPSGMSGLIGNVDLVYSRAVLEHVDDLDATYADMRRALRPGGVAIHLVDLRSHGLHRSHPLDFLCWPSWLWSLMYAYKGVPNRWRLPHHLVAARSAALQVDTPVFTTQLDAASVQAVRPCLDRPFRGLSDDDLAVQGFWLICRPMEGQTAGAAI